MKIGVYFLDNSLLKKRKPRRHCGENAEELVAFVFSICAELIPGFKDAKKRFIDLK